MHAGVDADGQEHNPLSHLMISERQNDGIERTREVSPGPIAPSPNVAARRRVATDRDAQIP
jgi:hypothetical protein